MSGAAITSIVLFVLALLGPVVMYYIGVYRGARRAFQIGYNMAIADALSVLNAHYGEDVVAEHSGGIVLSIFERLANKTAEEIRHETNKLYDNA